MPRGENICVVNLNVSTRVMNVIVIKVRFYMCKYVFRCRIPSVLRYLFILLTYVSIVRNNFEAYDTSLMPLPCTVKYLI